MPVECAPPCHCRRDAKLFTKLQLEGQVVLVRDLQGGEAQHPHGPQLTPMPQLQGMTWKMP